MSILLIILSLYFIISFGAYWIGIPMFLIAVHIWFNYSYIPEQKRRFDKMDKGRKGELTKRQYFWIKSNG